MGIAMETYFAINRNQRFALKFRNSVTQELAEKSYCHQKAFAEMNISLCLYASFSACINYSQCIILQPLKTNLMQN